MKKKIAFILITILLAVIVGGCSSGEDNTTSHRTFIDDALDTGSEPSETVEVILPHSTSDSEGTLSNNSVEDIRTIIDSYCENFLTYSDSPLDNIERIQDIITDEYKDSIKDIMGYNSDDDGYSQAVAVSKLYYSENPDKAEQVEVACLCFQNAIINETSSTISTFYVFKLIKDPGHGWLISSVDNYRDMIGG